MNKPLIDLIEKSRKFYLGGKYSLNEILNSQFSSEYLDNLLAFIQKYKKESGATLSEKDFILSCIAKGYRYENFALAFIEWSEKEKEQNQDKKQEYKINANDIFDEYERGENE